MTTAVKQQILAGALLLSWIGVAGAQNIDSAIAAYKAGDHAEASARFYEVLKFDTDEGNQAEAEYGLAQSFGKMGLHWPAINYYENIVETGPTHTYYFKAFDGLLESAELLQDDLKIPTILDKAYGKALAKMDAQALQRIHYMLGELSYRQGKTKDARDFLNTVKKGNRAYPRAQYLLALLKLGMGARKGKIKPDREGAQKHFQNVFSGIAEDAQGADGRLRKMATLGLARVFYEDAAQMDEADPARKQRLQEAVEYYESVPRLSDEWGQALFERAWAHFLLNEYGQSLGMMHTLQSPYFEDAYQPEMHVLRAIVYYFNCHYDRTYQALRTLETDYKPMLEVLKKVNAEERDAELWFDFMRASLAPKRLSSGAAKSGDLQLIPLRVGHAMALDAQWQKLSGAVAEIDKELAKVKATSAIADGPLGEETTNLLDGARKNFVKIAGRYAQRFSKKNEEDLQGFLNRGALVKLETATAEQAWLEAGVPLQVNVQRRRLPRPFIPDDTYIYWAWRTEYWADEVGFYRYGVKSECLEE
jgi:TolA-binding protein